MKIKTSITQIKDGKEVVRGKELEELIMNHSFVETIFLLLQKRMPEKNEARMLDAIFTAIIDHGPATTSALSARISASAKNNMHTSLAAGILSFGDRHGVALETAMKFLYDHIDNHDIAKTLAGMKARKEYVTGLGHKLLERDNRVDVLFALAKEHKMFGKYCMFIEHIHKEVNKQSSKVLPINVDGAVAGILCDMGFDYRVGRGIFVIGRIPGLVAHVMEEIEQDEGIRRLDNDDILYE